MMPMVPALRTFLRMQAHVYAGFFGGLASSAALQPLDLLKTRVQQAPTAGLLPAIRSLASLGEAWRGTVPSMIRTSVGAGLYLGLLNKLREAKQSSTKYQSRSSSILPRLSAYDNVATGAVARASVGFIMMPITVIKVRFESNLFQYRSVLAAAADIVRGPTGWRGLFAGYAATASRDAPYAGIYMLFYEFSKDALQYEWIPGPLINSIAAANAAILATTVTAPFDTIKTRIQVSVGKMSFLQAWRDVTKDSWKSLFDGLSLRLTRKALSSCISWCIYEEIVKKVSQESRRPEQ